MNIIPNFGVTNFQKNDVPHNIQRANTKPICETLQEKASFSDINRFQFPKYNSNVINIKFSGKSCNLKTEKLLDRKDFDEIYRLDNEEFGYIVQFANADEFWKYSLWKNIDTYVVKDRDDELIGYYQVYMPTKDNLYIETLNLKPEYRGKHTGFTSHVFNEITDIAKKNHAEKISLHVETKNQKAMDLYKRLGFRTKYEIENFYNSKTNPNAYYMEKRI